MSYDQTQLLSAKLMRFIVARYNACTHCRLSTTKDQLGGAPGVIFIGRGGPLAMLLRHWGLPVQRSSRRQRLFATRLAVLGHTHRKRANWRAPLHRNSLCTPIVLRRLLSNVPACCSSQNCHAGPHRAGQCKSEATGDASRTHPQQRCQPGPAHHNPGRPSQPKPRTAGAGMSSWTLPA